MAMALSYGTTDFIEGAVITVVIVCNLFTLNPTLNLVNISIGFMQEYKAEKTMDSLRKLSSPTGSVLRNSEVHSIPSSQIVPGDVVILKTGDIVPADIRLYDSMNFEVDEALLTGESLPVPKSARATYEREVGVGDRINMAYASTVVTRGRAKGIVTAIGMTTEMGKIAEALRIADKRNLRRLKRRGQDHPISFWRKVRTTYTWLKEWSGIVLGLTVGTPLQRKLSKLAYLLFFLALVLAFVVFGANKFNLSHQVCIYAISLGIAIIPESLIAVLSITMAIGTRAMAQRHVIVRKLDALEALGGVTNICSDKTGTLTQGRMIAKKVWIMKTNATITVDSSEAYNPTVGKVTIELAHGGTKEVKSSAEVPSDKLETLADLMDDNSYPLAQTAALCNLAVVRKDERTNVWNATGDPTEIALQVFAHRLCVERSALMKEWVQLLEFPFDSAIKRMTVVFRHQHKGDWAFLKGAVERVLDVCSSAYADGEIQQLEIQSMVQIMQQMESFASQGLVSSSFHKSQ